MIEIRTASADEWSALQRLNDEVFADNYKYDYDLKLDWAQSDAGKRYFQALVSDDTSACFVAEDTDTKQLVGYVAAIPRQFDYRKSNYGDLFRTLLVFDTYVNACLSKFKLKQN